MRHHPPDVAKDGESTVREKGYVLEALQQSARYRINMGTLINNATNRQGSCHALPGEMNFRVLLRHQDISSPCDTDSSRCEYRDHFDGILRERFHNSANTTPAVEKRSPRVFLSIRNYALPVCSYIASPALN